VPLLTLHVVSRALHVDLASITTFWLSAAGLFTLSVEGSSVKLATGGNNPPFITPEYCTLLGNAADSG